MTTAEVDATKSKERQRRSVFSPAAVSVLLILVLGICASGAYLVAILLPQQYQAKAELLVPLGADGATNTTNLQTQIALLTSAAVLQQTAQQQNVPFKKVGDAVTVTQSATSQVLTVTVKYSNGKAAVRLARGVLSSYDKVVASSIRRQSGLQYLQTEISNLRQQLADLDSNAKSADSGDQRTLILSRITALQGQLVSAQLNNIEATQPVDVVTEPYLDNSVVSSQPVLAAVAGVVGGLVIDSGIFFVWLRRRQDRALFARPTWLDGAE